MCTLNRVIAHRISNASEHNCAEHKLNGFLFFRSTEKQLFCRHAGEISIKFN